MIALAKCGTQVTGDELLTLDGHRNVVYAIAFNNPYYAVTVTRSSQAASTYHTYRGHATDEVCLSFIPHGAMIATGSVDNTARLWDVEAGECLHTLLGHTVEIASLNFDTQG